MDPVVRAFLQGRHIAALATTSKDGSSHLSNVWYLLEGDVVYVQTPQSSVKARNVLRTPRASILVDTRRADALRGAAGVGPAELLDGDEVAGIRERIMARYMTPEGMADPEIGGLMRIHDDRIIRLRPEKWTWWDVGAMFREKIFKPGVLLDIG